MSGVADHDGGEQRRGARGGEGVDSAARRHSNRPRLINCRNMYDPLPLYLALPYPPVNIVTMSPVRQEKSFEGSV